MREGGQRPAPARAETATGGGWRRTALVRWMRSYGLMMRWELLGLRLMLPLMLIVQLFLGAGLAIGFGLLFEDIPATQALYLSTGSAVITMLVVGLGLAPQIVAQHKMRQTYDFLWSLPVSRLAQVSASISVWILVTVPGMALALVVAAWRYDLSLSVETPLVPAMLLTLLVSTSVGFAMAHALPPMVTTMATQVLIFVILMFSPINYPAHRLPEWLQTVHVSLPFQHAATVMRAGLTQTLGEGAGLSFAVLAAWTLAGWGVLAWVLGRRG